MAHCHSWQLAFSFIGKIFSSLSWQLCPPVWWVFIKSPPRWCHDEACHGSNIVASKANTRRGESNHERRCWTLSPTGGCYPHYQWSMCFEHINIITITINNDHNQKSSAEPLNKSWLAWQSSHLELAFFRSEKRSARMWRWRKGGCCEVHLFHEVLEATNLQIIDR